MSDTLSLKAYAVVFGLVAGVSGLYTHGTAEQDTFTVDRVERTGGDNGKYLLWTTEGDVYKVADSWWNLHFSASDVYGKLKEGNTYTADTYGWRVPFFSVYPNIVDAQKIEGAKTAPEGNQPSL